MSRNFNPTKHNLTCNWVIRRIQTRRWRNAHLSWFRKSLLYFIKRKFIWRQQPI